MTLHQYRGASLDNVYLENGYERHETKWGSGTSYSDVDGLFIAIAKALCLSEHKLGGDEVRFLRKHLNMTQDALGHELGCTGQAVAKWEKGDTRIPDAPARLLRLLVIRGIDPQLPVEQALVAYREPRPERLVLRYNDTSSWQCIEPKVLSPEIAVSFQRTNSIAFAKQVRARLDATIEPNTAQFPFRSFPAYAENDHRFAQQYESQLASA